MDEDRDNGRDGYEREGETNDAFDPSLSSIDICQE